MPSISALLWDPAGSWVPRAALPSAMRLASGLVGKVVRTCQGGPKKQSPLDAGFAVFELQFKDSWVPGRVRGVFTPSRAETLFSKLLNACS